MKNFALIGASGFVAPRHMRAVKETGNTLLAAYDPYDGIGVMDSYFPKADFFTEFERFDRHLDKLRRKETHIDYTSICSPNYLHDAHIRYAIRNGSDVICEKPLVLNPWNIDALLDLEKTYGQKIYTILQLRLHPAIIALKKQIDEAKTDRKYEVDLTYITPRGHWYYTSWKGNQEKSGGIATNIGVHFFDMLLWIFGAVEGQQVHVHQHDRASGTIQFEKANVRWFLSINADTLPPIAKAKGEKTFRSIRVDEKEIEFSEGFTDLHTESYKSVIEGNGFTLMDAAPSITLVEAIRTSAISPFLGDYHPLAKIPSAKHPFFAEH